MPVYVSFNILINLIMLNQIYIDICKYTFKKRELEKSIFNFCLFDNF